MAYCPNCGAEHGYDARFCPRCGRALAEQASVLPSEPGEEGVVVRKGDSLIIPAGTIRFSFNPEQATGKFFRPGIAWFAQMLYFHGYPENSYPKTSEELDCLLEHYQVQADETLRNSPLLEDLNIDVEADADEGVTRIQANQYTPEFWALAVGSVVREVRDSVADGDAQRTAGAMNLLANARAMLIFHQQIEESVWHGQMRGDLKRMLELWDEHKDNADEEFWQSTLSHNAFLLSHLFSFPVILLEDKAYVGGKGIDNRGGNLVDYLVTNHLTDNTALVEIKTPKTKLLSSQPYRGGVFSAFSDLVGAVMQVSNYKHSLIEECGDLVRQSEEEFYAFNPRCLVVVGTFEDEITDQRRRKSFELFRSGLKDVEIVTYDEMFSKARHLLGVL